MWGIPNYLKHIKSLITTERLNLTIQANCITMSEKPLIELSYWDMPPANSTN